MRILVLGFVFDLDLSSVPFGEDIEIKPHHYVPKSNKLPIMRRIYGKVQTGEITFCKEGAFIHDRFSDFKGKVGEAPWDFDPNGANNGIPAILFEQDGDTACIELEDGMTATVNFKGDSVWIDEASHEYTEVERLYILTTAQQMRAA